MQKQALLECHVHVVAGFLLQLVPAAYLGRIVGIRCAAGAQPIPNGQGYIIGSADVQDLVPVLISKVLL